MKKASLVGALSLLTAFIFSTQSAFAGSTILYLTAAPGTLTQGSTLTLQIKENSGTDEVNAVQANLTYPNSMLDYIGVEDSSAFNVVAQTYNKPGVLNLARGSLPPPLTGVQTVATVKFKVKKNSGNITIQFDKSSMVAKADGNGTNILSGTTAGYYTIGAATTAPAVSTSTISTSSPPSPTIDSVTSAGQTTSTASLSTQPISTTESQPLVLSGVTIPNGIVTLYVYSDPQKFTTIADKDGAWKYAVIGLPPGQHRVEVEVTDPVTNKTSERKQILAFSVKPAASLPTALVDKNIPLWYGLLLVPIALCIGAACYRVLHKRRAHAKPGLQTKNPPDPTQSHN